jgi:hypothetical protein
MILKIGKTMMVATTLVATVVSAATVYEDVRCK